MTYRARIQGIRINEKVIVEPSSAKLRDSYGGAVRVDVPLREIDLDADGVRALVDALERAFDESQATYRAQQRST